VLVPFNRDHAELYNDLVAHVRRALLLADWGDPSQEQSLQNPKNARLGRTAVDNLREACNVAGRYPTATLMDEIDESIQMVRDNLVASHGAPAPKTH
jgi:hypothetical protein